MDTDVERRKAFEEFYASLSPQERRGRLFLKPEFRDAYNELVEADRQFPVPTYLWEKWVPLVGVFPVAVYIELRRMCFVNRATGERRDWCWPRQETLAQRLGVRKRQTVGEALQVLESHGFISREKSYRRRGGQALMQRGSDRYLVYFEVPLVPSDAVELLIRRTTPNELEGGSANPLASGLAEVAAEPPETVASDTSEKRTNRDRPDMSAKRTYRESAVDNSPDTSEKRTYPAVRKTDSRTITRTITKNVPNVADSNDLKTGEALQERSPHGNSAPRNAAILADEIGDYLGTLSGSRQTGSHQSAGFHRLVASRLPETLVREALRATRDAVDDQRAGKKTLDKGPSAYFAGIVKQLAKDNGVDLGLKAGGGLEQVGEEPRARTSMGAGKVREVSGEEAPPSDEERARVKAFLREFTASLGSEDSFGR